MKKEILGKPKRMAKLTGYSIKKERLEKARRNGKAKCIMTKLEGGAKLKSFIKKESKAEKIINTERRIMKARMRAKLKGS